MTVNITCQVCDGRNLCEACRSAARTLSAAGFRIEHSTRYAAMRAAASGTYGFDACVVPVSPHERAVIDAAVSLFSGKRLAFVAEQTADVPVNASLQAAVLPRSQYDAGEFSLAWLTDGQKVGPRREVTAATIVSPAGPSDLDDLATDQAHATRRLKRLANVVRTTVAQAGLPVAPRLDLVAVLEDEVAWARSSAGVFGAILIHLPGVATSKGRDAAGASEKRIRDAAGASEKRIRDAEQVIARAVRASDIVCGRGDDFLVVLPEASEAGVALAMRRVAAAVASSKLRASSKPRRARGFAAWSIGAASYPEDGTTRDVLLAHATATLKPLAG